MHCSPSGGSRRSLQQVLRVAKAHEARFQEPAASHSESGLACQVLKSRAGALLDEAIALEALFLPFCPAP